MQTYPDALVRNVVERAQAFVEPDGKLEVISVTGSSVRVAYKVADNPTCAECVLAPGDLEIFLTEMFSREVPQIRQVNIEATGA